MPASLRSRLRVADAAASHAGGRSRRDRALYSDRRRVMPGTRDGFDSFAREACSVAGCSHPNPGSLGPTHPEAKAMLPEGAVFIGKPFSARGRSLPSEGYPAATSGKPLPLRDLTVSRRLFASWPATTRRACRTGSFEVTCLRAQADAEKRDGEHHLLCRPAVRPR